MDYNNLEKYAEKYNVLRMSRNDHFNGYTGGRFELVTYGSNYFFNTKMHIDALLFSFQYNTGAANYSELKKQAEKIKKYATRYGFAVCFEGFNISGFWFVVMPADEKKQLDIICFFERQCINECELLMHIYHRCGIYEGMHKQLNTMLYDNMTRWEGLYLEYIEKYNKQNNYNKLHFVA